MENQNEAKTWVGREKARAQLGLYLLKMGGPQATAELPSSW